MNRKLGTKYSTKNVTEWLNLLVNLVPGCVSVDGKYVGVQASATIIKLRIHKVRSEIPLDMQPMYNEIFSQSEGV